MFAKSLGSITTRKRRKTCLGWTSQPLLGSQAAVSCKFLVLKFTMTQLCQQRNRSFALKSKIKKETVLMKPLTAKTYYLTTNDCSRWWPYRWVVRVRKVHLWTWPFYHLESADLTTYAAINPNFARFLCLLARIQMEMVTRIEESTGCGSKDAASKPGQSNPANPANLQPIINSPNKTKQSVVLANLIISCARTKTTRTTFC